MSMVSEIYGEVETLRGLLTALLVNFPDLTPRLEPAIAKVDAVLNNPTDQTIAFFIEDMIELEIYFRDVYAMLHKESDSRLMKSIQNTVELIVKLMGPDKKVELN